MFHQAMMQSASRNDMEIDMGTFTALHRELELSTVDMAPRHTDRHIDRATGMPRGCSMRDMPDDDIYARHARILAPIRAARAMRPMTADLQTPLLDGSARLMDTGDTHGRRDISRGTKRTRADADLPAESSAWVALKPEMYASVRDVMLAADYDPDMPALMRFLDDDDDE